MLRGEIRTGIFDVEVFDLSALVAALAALVRIDELPQSAPESFQRIDPDEVRTRLNLPKPAAAPAVFRSRRRVNGALLLLRLRAEDADLAPRQKKRRGKRGRGKP